MNQCLLTTISEFSPEGTSERKYAAKVLRREQLAGLKVGQTGKNISVQFDSNTVIQFQVND